MPSRAAPFSLILAAFSALCAPPAVAAGPFSPDDPLGTHALLPPRLLPAGMQQAGRALPCAEPVADTPLDALAAVNLALCANPQTRETWANAQVQAAQFGVASSAWLPSLDARVAANSTDTGNGRRDQRSAALTLSYLLLDFGARDASVESARQLLAAASSSLDTTVQSVFLLALQSYYTAQAQRAAVAAALESERASRESLNAAEARYRIGTGTPADRLQAQTAWSQATLNRIRSEGELRNALGTLANVLGLDASRPLNLAEWPAAAPETSFERDVDALIAEARDRRPDLRAAEAQVNAARAGIDVARSAGRPTVSVGIGPSWQDLGTGSGLTSGSSVGLTLNVPIFSGYATTYRVRSAEAQAEARAAQRDRLRLQVALDVWRAYQSLNTATQSLRTTADLLASAEQSGRVALGRYRAGVGNILDVLNAQSALAAARQQRVQATLDWNVYRAALAQAIGTLDIGLLQTDAGKP